MRAKLSPASQGADEVPNSWNRALTVEARAWGGFVCVFFALFLASCTTPYQQLALPSPINPPSGTEPARPDTATNMLLSKRGTASNEATTYAGSGKFTADAGPAARPPGAGPAKIRPSAGPTSQVTSDGVTINLSGATIAEVSKTILGDVLGVTYSVSDKLKGSITLNTAHPVSKESLLKIYESVIRNEGAVLVVKGELYEVVPSADAAASGAPLRRSSSTGLGSEIVPLRFVSAAEMERVLKSSAPQAGVLRADSTRNVLVLSGTPSEIAALRELVDVFDVDWMRGMSFGLFPIEAADPEAIAKELDVVFANDRDSPSKGIVRFIGNRRLKSVLVISVRPEYLRKAELWIQRIDKVRQATQKQAHVYHVQHRPVNDLAKLLQKVYSGGQGGGSGSGGSASGSSTSSLEQSRPTSAVATGSMAASPGGAATGSAATGAATGAAGGGASAAAANASSSEGSLPADGGGHESASSGGSSAPASDDRSAGISIVADEPNNSLVITATANEYRRVLAILETLDTHPNELLLESTIAEVTLNDQLNFGVRWFFQNKAGNQSVGFTDTTGKIPGPLAGLSYFINTTNVSVLLNALSNVTDVNVLSQPSLMVLENKKATLQVGDEVPILTQTQQSAAAVGTPTISNAVSYRNTGILLGITPRVSNDGKVLLEIEQEVSDTKSNTTSGIDSPSFSQRRVKTTVTVQDGQTIVLAGMMQDKATRSRDKVPLVGDIPLVGNIFKNKTDTINRTELLIAITPHVIRDNRQINAVTSEFRDSLNFSTRPQRKAGPDQMENVSRIVR